jgi:hypothetical protein
MSQPGTPAVEFHGTAALIASSSEDAWQLAGYPALDDGKGGTFTPDHLMIMQVDYPGQDRVTMVVLSGRRGTGRGGRPGISYTLTKTGRLAGLTKAPGWLADLVTDLTHPEGPSCVNR